MQDQHQFARSQDSTLMEPPAGNRAGHDEGQVPGDGLPAVPIRPAIGKLEEYIPSESLDSFSARVGIPIAQLIKLDANENPYGPSPRAHAALEHFQRYHFYPDPTSTALRAALSRYLGVEPTHIVPGNGSDEIIDLLSRLFLEPGDRILTCTPTFDMYAVSAQICGAEVTALPRRPDFSIPVEEILDALSPQTRIIYVCSPNNPTGNIVPDRDVFRLLETGRLVVVDEAYSEFSGRSLVTHVPHYPNLVVLRTFSKWAGLAGLRVGYGVVPEWIARTLWKIKFPYDVNAAAQLAAIESLADLDYLCACVARIVAERERLFALLRRQPFLEVYPSHANFILSRFTGDGVHSETVRTAMEGAGILLRYYRRPPLAQALRVSVGTPAQTDRLAAVLATLPERS